MSNDLLSRAYALFYVLPRFAADDISDSARIHSVVSRYRDVLVSIRRAPANTANVVISEFSARVLGTHVNRRLRTASLGSHVRQVVGIRPNKQMCGVDAASVVALMADKHCRFQGRRDMKTPTNSMGKVVPPVEPPDVHLPVAATVARAAPLPTWTEMRNVRRNGSVFVDLAPEPCDRFLIHAGNLRVGQRPGRVRATPGALARIA